jgi:D-3-phosphoglycerate dehydrogenase
LNLSRGKIVNTTELIQAIKTGIVWKCALDVLENEQLNLLNTEEKILFEQLCKHENVILSPHIGGWTHESYVKISQVLLDKLLTFSKKLTLI